MKSSIESYTGFSKKVDTVMEIIEKYNGEKHNIYIVSDDIAFWKFLDTYILVPNNTSSESIKLYRHNNLINYLEKYEDNHDRVIVIMDNIKLPLVEGNLEATYHEQLSKCAGLVYLVEVHNDKKASIIDSEVDRVCYALENYFK